jgi:hypothetical protein
MLLGLVVTAISAIGTVSIGPIGFNIYMLLLGMTAVILGNSLFQVGLLARATHGLRNGIEVSIARHFTYDRGMILSGVLVLVGLVLDTRFLYDYVSGGFTVTNLSRSAIVGLLSIILGVQTFSFTLMVELKRRLGAAHR